MRSMKIAIGADHGGYPIKAEIVKFLKQAGYTLKDLGTFSGESVDYPDYARAVAGALRGGKAGRGILVCGSGVGACVAVNKFPGIRAAVCHDSFSARQGVEDDDMNVICLGGRVTGFALAWDLIQAFLTARFIGGERHQRRLDKISALESRGKTEGK